jgi:ATP-dependent Clp protease ATP-binding subunit ClpA
MIGAILEAIAEFLKWVFESIKVLWVTDKFVTAYLGLAIVLGTAYNVKLELYWLAVLVLLGLFSLYSYHSKQQPLNILNDYILIFGLLSGKNVNQLGQKTGGLGGTIKPEYIAPPRINMRPNAPAAPSTPGAPVTAQTCIPANQVKPKSKVNVIGKPSTPSPNNRNNDKEDIKNLETILKENILSQDQAIEFVIKGIKRRLAGTEANKNAPLCFLMTGPTGTGKTQLVKLVSNALKREFDRYDMGNFKNEATLWQLLGSPQGYVGEAGKLTQFVKKNPNSVILFDEIEKGCNQMYDFMLPMIDEGIVKDNKTNETIKFQDAIVFFTTNLITDVREEARENVEVIRNELESKGFLKPELIGRVRNIVPFYRFSDEDIIVIVEKQIAEYLDNVCNSKQYDASYEYHYDVIQFIASSVDKTYGARNVSQQIEKYIGNELTEELFNWGDKPISEIKLILKEKKIIVELSEELRLEEVN